MAHTASSVGLTYFCFRLLALSVSMGFFFGMLTSSAAHSVTVCSYNLWNVMFIWEVRILHVAEMVRKAECDVLMLQEVRLHRDRSWSQAQHLQHLLPEFQWEVTRLANHVPTPPQSYLTGWEAEGLAVLSKIPIGTVWSEHLSRSHGPDTNQRIALHVPVLVTSHLTVNIIVVHFSYHREQQCQNAVEILDFIHRKRLDHVVVAGDFNIYPDFPFPVQLFLGETGNSHDNKCRTGPRMLLVPTASVILKDAWTASQGNLTGNTFSNMPIPGLVSRPDRILTSSDDINVLSTSLIGNGTAYRTKLASSILFHRVQRVLATAKDTFVGRRGHSCMQDCGPRGSCRCGVCVVNDLLEPCHLPDCEECSSWVHAQLCGLALVVLVHLFVAGSAAVKILVVASRVDQSDAVYILGWTCCLFNPRLLFQPTFSSRHKGGRMLRFLGVGKVPPLVLLTISLTLMCMCIATIVLWNMPTVRTIFSVLPEEYFPSDHLMLIAELNVL